jgi:hypothetical protein
MSQYRDDLDAAQRRVETLEAKLKERDATIAVKEAELAEREADLARLERGAEHRRELPSTAPPGSPRYHTNLLGLVLAASSFAMAAGYIGVMNRAAHPCSLGHDPSFLREPLGNGVMLVPAPTAEASPDPTTAGREAVGPNPDTLRDPFAGPNVTPKPALDEERLRDALAPKVWSGHAGTEEIRMLKAICSHLGDRACRDRAAEALAKKKGPPESGDLGL